MKPTGGIGIPDMPEDMPPVEHLRIDLEDCGCCKCYHRPVAIGIVACIGSHE
jgi:hypothetical protein